ncbi:anhydro-N-acetylmuramic acid kinase [Alkalimonas sp. MEB108]|uniref:Anhydro-N-acetylmuramic acid kinase n=1 Tax=Alkalimonas cellulosilytica TaxID=3058395 RepID=A0ABU7J9U6_9GAMM|nr:anhydro-N-acetylmuramic acid kinase [Alkalimonas sp. MEB108]MEE2003107.1 anhydro-N-acetylmuramic acid kinase [Alkalimonas sp. MEB108]
MVPQLYIGIMSGTSLDGIDLVLTDFTTKPSLLGSCLIPFPASLQRELRSLAEPGNNEVERIGPAEHQLAECYAAGVKQLLKQVNYLPEQISAIGCHGQTIRHRPNQLQPFTMQLGNMHLLAALTGIRVIADFRRKDMAYGGQGAPLVPAFHQAVFAKAGKNRAVVNIGGIANISLLQADGTITGYDTGPGNCLMDDWVSLHRQLPYDKDGAFSAEGELLPELLQQLLADDYFQLSAPKSTGREYFHLGWLRQKLTGLEAPADVQRTLSRFTALSIANELQLPNLSEVFICGGGVHHPVLMADLQQLLTPAKVQSSSSAGVDPDWVEAMAFAWLAQAFDKQLPGNVPAVTGARKACVLGVSYSP